MWVRLTCDYNAISVLLQLQLPTGTELGNNINNRDFLKYYNCYDLDNYIYLSNIK